MLKCWNYSADQRPNFRYCLEVLQSLQDQTSEYTKITTQFTADQFKNWSSGSGQILSSTMQQIANNPTLVTPPSSASSQVIAIPKYLELMYDESLDSNNNAGDDDEPKIPQILRNNSRASGSSHNSKRSSVGMRSLIQGDGYEIPIASDILELKRISLSDNKHRTLSNSSTVSNSSTLPHSPLKEESNNSKQIIIKC